MITLHYFPGNASFAPHAVLHELGLPFDLQLVDRAVNAQKSASHLRLNPNGLIPVLQDGDLTLFETAAICLHLADSHPAGQLAPALGTLERAHFYKWLMWLSNTVQATLTHYFYPERLVDEGNADAAAQVKRHAEARVVACLAILDKHLAQASQTGPWMMGAQYSLLDPYAWLMCRWTRAFEQQPARSFSFIAPYLQRVQARPAMQRAIDAEGLVAPLV